AEARLTTAQVYNADILKLLSVMPGGRKLEQELHKKFVNFHIHGEWFKPNNELSDLIKSLPYIGSTVNDFRRSGPRDKNHHFWRNTNATDSSKRSRAARRFKIKDDVKCQICFDKKAIERFHKDLDLDNLEQENILLVCRACCMKLDGRMDSFLSIDRSSERVPAKQCIVCKELRKNLRKGRCHSCNEYYRRNGRERSEILNI